MDPVTIVKTAQLAATLARSRTLRVVIVTAAVLQGFVLVALMLVPGDLVAGLAGQHAKRLYLASDDSCDAGLGEPASTTATLPGFNTTQVTNAHTIWTVARQLGMGDRAAVIGIATAMQESTLRNLGYGDRDSVGLFQQRAGWGTRATRMNPTASATLFFNALAKVRGWQGLPVTVAAQRVQISAFPTAYAKHERGAHALVNLFTTDRQSGGLASMTRQVTLAGGMCDSPGAGGGMSCPVTGWGVEHGLTPDALRVLRCVHQRWPQIRSFGGVGDRPANVDRDHQQGRAVDIMIHDPSTASGKTVGDQIAAWAQHNAPRLGVTYIIWQTRIWSVQRRTEGWRACGSSKASCYAGSNDTAAHRDHVHISVNGNTAHTSNGSGSGGGVSGRVVRPVASYRLTARFGQCSSRWRACHTGLDFATGTGTPIRAVGGGTVTYVGWGGAYGRLTKIRMVNGTQAWYAHQSAQLVHPGQNVRAGQTIGRGGATGNTTGPHVHLEIRIGGRPVNPAPWLSARGARP